MEITQKGARKSSQTNLSFNKKKFNQRQSSNIFHTEYGMYKCPSGTFISQYSLSTYSLRFQNRSFEFDFEASFLASYSTWTSKRHLQHIFQIRLQNFISKFLFEAMSRNHYSYYLNSNLFSEFLFEFLFETLFLNFYLHLS